MRFIYAASMLSMTAAFVPSTLRSVRRQIMDKHTNTFSPNFASVEETGVFPDTEDDNENKVGLDDKFATLPRHASNCDVNEILERVEEAIATMKDDTLEKIDEIPKDESESSDRVYSNSYVDLGKVSLILSVSKMHG